jgi:CheY-like chemotaxis protein
MARVLIAEPQAEVRMLLGIVVRRLGHDPVDVGVSLDRPPEVDAAIVEPGGAGALPLARRLRDRGVPVLFASIYPAEADALGVDPDAYLVKPFPLAALERALQQALAGAA